MPSNADSTHGGLLRASGMFPENFIKTNPQFNTANFLTNSEKANYHSMQAQISLRPTSGVSLQATYTWSRNLGVMGAATNPLNRNMDYTLLASNRSHVFNTYGTFDLPFGPRRMFFSNTHGAAARILEDWQGSWIINASTGIPISVTASSMLYANGVPDLVGPFDFNSVGVNWPDGAQFGNFFGNRYRYTRDPQCSAIDASLQGSCNLQAVADTSGRIIFQNPKPGNQGSFGRNKLFGPGNWTLDMALSKGVRITEGIGFRVRLDATNIFNHPQASNGQFNSGVRIITAMPPATDINSSTTFGQFDRKVGTRTYQLTGRLSF
jgi:hypothetical protein